MRFLCFDMRNNDHTCLLPAKGPPSHHPLVRAGDRLALCTARGGAAGFSLSHTRHLGPVRQREREDAERAAASGHAAVSTVGYAYTANWFTSSDEVRMKTVGACQAKTQLSRLLDEVERGETVIITRHGAPVAVLSPAKPVRDTRTGEQILAQMKRIREGITLGGIPIRAVIAERRWWDCGAGYWC